MVAPIDEDQGAGLGGGGTAGAVAAGTPAVLGRQAEGAADLADALAAEWEAVDLPQLLGDVAVVDILIDSLEQLGHAGAELVGQGAGRRAPPSRMQQTTEAGPLEALLEALKLPDAQTEGGGALGVGDPAGHGGFHQPGPGYFLAAHREGVLPCLHGVTLSRGS